MLYGKGWPMREEKGVDHSRTLTGFLLACMMRSAAGKERWHFFGSPSHGQEIDGESG